MPKVGNKIKDLVVYSLFEIGLNIWIYYKTLMKKTKKLWNVIFISLISLLLIVQAFGVVQEIQRDRDRVQDPLTHDETQDYPLQERDQDQDRDRDLNQTNYQSNGQQTRVMVINGYQDGMGPSMMGDSQRLREMIESHQRISQEQIGNQDSNSYQNRMMTGGYAFMYMGNFSWNESDEMYRLGNEIQVSTQQTIRNEERIRNRSQFVRFFAGGDFDTANELLMETNRNQERIRELERLVQNCSCDNETKIVLQEQIRNMEMEQQRLQRLADEEIERRGIFGWIWR